MKGTSEDTNKQMTYLSCGAGSVLTLQIPAAITNKVSDCYSLMAEVRFPTLPPPGQIAALLTFVQEPDKPSRVALADIYVHRDGSVGRVDQEPIGEDRMQANSFHVVHVVVAGSTLKTYVDGEFCAVDSGSSSLKLREKINVFGMSKQSHLRGGAIKRLSVRCESMSTEEVKEHAKQVESCSKAKLVRFNRIKSEDKPVAAVLSQLPSCDLLTVDTEEELFSLLETKEVDIVLSDLWFDEIRDADEDSLSFPGFEAHNVCIEPPGLSLANRIRSVAPEVAVVLGTRKPLPYDADSLAPLEVGALVEAKFADGKAFFAGKIVRANKNRTYKISYNDEDNENSVQREKIRLRGDDTDIEQKTSFDRPEYDLSLKHALSGFKLYAESEHLRIVLSYLSVLATRKKQLL